MRIGIVATQQLSHLEIDRNHPFLQLGHSHLRGGCGTAIQVSLHQIVDHRLEHHQLGRTQYHFYHVEPRRLILIGRIGEPENIVSSIHLMNDCTVMAVGTKRGNLSVY